LDFQIRKSGAGAPGGSLWRIRIGDYRVIYTIDDETKKVEVTRIAHRREADQA
jgi:mRNA interferase RelE/StbE